MHWLQFEVIVLAITSAAVFVAAGMMIWDAVRDIKRAKRLEQRKRTEPK